jgi:predicted esterase
MMSEAGTHVGVNNLSPQNSNMKRIIIIALLFFSIAHGQTLTPKPGVQLASGVGGYYEYLPAGYDGKKKFPLIIFFHGLGQQGNGTSQLPSLVAKGNGLIAMLADKSVPDQGMIIIGPQYVGWPTADQSLQVLNRIIELYPVDTTRIYVTGLSMGGGATWELAALAGKRIAAIAPICGASSPDQNRIKALVAASMPIKAFHDQRDPMVPYLNSTGYVNGFNALSGKPTATLYTYNEGIHNSWGDAYLPYQGIYDFFRTYTRGGIQTPTPGVPTDPTTYRISASQNPPPGWVSDRSFVTVKSGYWGGTNAIWGESKPIAGTTEQALYNLERWGEFEYRVPVANGVYQVKLHFVELWRTTVGRRVFNVDIEGQRVLDRFDIISNVPRFTALSRTFDVTVSDGIMNIVLSNVSENATLSAVEIMPRGTVIVPPQYIYTTQFLDSATGVLLRSRADTFTVPVKVVIK